MLRRPWKISYWLSTNFDSVILLLLQPIKAEVQFRVQPAYYELSTKITAELNQAINVGHSAWCRL